MKSLKEIAQLTQKAANELLQQPDIDLLSDKDRLWLWMISLKHLEGLEKAIRGDGWTTEQKIAFDLEEYALFVFRSIRKINRELKRLRKQSSPEIP